MNRWVFAAVVVALSSSSRGARASEVERVDLAIAAAPAEVSAFEPVLRDLAGTTAVPIEITRVSAIDPRTVVQPPDGFAPGVARVFVDIQAKVALVYFVDPTWSRVLVRRIPLSKGFDEVAREQLAQVIVGAIDALRAGAVIGITRAEAEIELGVPPVMKLSPAPPSVLLLKEAQPLAEVARFFPSLGVAYEGAAWASAVAWHAIGGSFGVRTESLSLNLTALAHLPIVVDHPAVGLRVDGVSARVDGAWHVPLGPRLGAYVGVGVGLDRLRIEPRAAGASESQASPGGVRTAWVPTARSTVAIEGRASTNLRLRLGFFLERDLAPRNYVVQRSSGEFETVVEPLSVRPGVSLVIAADL